MSTTHDTMKNSAEFSAYQRERQTRVALTTCRDALSDAHPDNGDHDGLRYCRCKIAIAWRKADAALAIRAPRQPEEA